MLFKKKWNSCFLCTLTQYSYVVLGIGTKHTHVLQVVKIDPVLDILNHKRYTVYVTLENSALMNFCHEKYRKALFSKAEKCGVKT